MDAVKDKVEIDGMSLALEALHSCADHLREKKGITEVSVDNDNDSGEIYFSTGDQHFMLVLKEQ